MALKKILFFGFLTIFTSCNGQEKTNTFKDPNTSNQSPQVIKNFKAVAMAPDFDTTLVSQYIRSIFQDSKGNLWFGTIAEGVVRYNNKTLTYFSNADGFYSNSVFAINEDKNGNLWFGTDQGVYKYEASLPDGHENKFRNYNQKDGLSHIDISRKSILVDQSGTVWVGTHAGVFRYDPAADSAGEQSFPCLSSFSQSMLLALWKTEVEPFGLPLLTKVFFVMTLRHRTLRADMPLPILQKRKN